MCLRCICECVVEAVNAPPEFGGISVVCDSVEKLFPFGLLFVLEFTRNFIVQCSQFVADIPCGEFVSEVVINDSSTDTSRKVTLPRMLRHPDVCCCFFQPTTST